MRYTYEEDWTVEANVIPSDDKVIIWIRSGLFSGQFAVDGKAAAELANELLTASEEVLCKQ